MLQFDHIIYDLLCDNKSLYQFIVEHAADGAWIAELPNIEQVFINQKLAKFLNTSEDSYSLSKLVDQKTLDILMDRQVEATLEKPLMINTTIQDQLQAAIIQDIHVVSFSVSGKSYLLGAHKGMFQEIESSKLLNQYKKIIKGTNLGTWQWNVATDELIVDDRWAEMIGYTVEELMPLSFETWIKICHPEDLELSKQELERHFEGDTAYYGLECRLRHKEGYWVWVLVKGKVFTWTDQGKPEWMLGSHQEISESKAIELESVKFKELLERTSIIANMGVWEYNVDKEELYWGKTTKAIHEVPKNFNPGVEEAISFYPEGIHRENIQRYFGAAVEKGESYDIELQIRTYKGNLKWVRAIGIPEVVEGKCIRVYGLFQDIDKIKRVQRDRDVVMQTTKEQNKRLTNFAHIVSHNLRSHSNNFSMLTQMLQKGVSDEKKEKIIELLIQASVNLKETIENLDEVANINVSLEEKFESLNLKIYIEEAVKTQETAAEEAQVEIHNLVKMDSYIHAVPAYLESIILNFLTNAIKYSDREKVHSYVKIYTIDNIHDVKLIFEDNGLGIDLKRHGEKLFGMYKTFHKHKDAKGLGLFIAKNQIDALGGTIKVESEPGKGTKFTIVFQKALSPL